MIDSITRKTYRKIVIDKLIMNDDSKEKIILDEVEIKKEVNKHFQTVAGSTNTDIQPEGRWIKRYEPIAEIEDNIYSELNKEIDTQEWNSVLHDTPKNKAAGPSTIPYEMIISAGDETKEYI